MGLYNPIPGPSPTSREGNQFPAPIIEELGLVVFRVKTEIVEKSLPIALALIRGKIQELKQNPEVPSPHVAEGQGGG